MKKDTIILVLAVVVALLIGYVAGKNCPIGKDCSLKRGSDCAITKTDCDKSGARALGAEGKKACCADKKKDSQ